MSRNFAQTDPGSGCGRGHQQQLPKSSVFPIQRGRCPRHPAIVERALQVAGEAAFLQGRVRSGSGLRLHVVKGGGVRRSSFSRPRSLVIVMRVDFRSFAQIVDQPLLSCATDHDLSPVRHSSGGELFHQFAFTVRASVMMLTAIVPSHSSTISDTASPRKRAGLEFPALIFRNVLRDQTQRVRPFGNLCLGL